MNASRSRRKSSNPSVSSAIAVKRLGDAARLTRGESQILLVLRLRVANHERTKRTRDPVRLLMPPLAARRPAGPWQSARSAIRPCSASTPRALHQLARNLQLQVDLSRRLVGLRQLHAQLLQNVLAQRLAQGLDALHLGRRQGFAWLSSRLTSSAITPSSASASTTLLKSLMKVSRSVSSSLTRYTWRTCPRGCGFQSPSRSHPPARTGSSDST